MAVNIDVALRTGPWVVDKGLTHSTNNSQRQSYLAAAGRVPR